MGGFPAMVCLLKNVPDTITIPYCLETALSATFSEHAKTIGQNRPFWPTSNFRTAVIIKLGIPNSREHCPHYVATWEKNLE